MVKLINGFCYLLCVVCVFGAVALALQSIWSDMVPPPYRWKYIVTLAVVFVGAVIVLRITRRMRRR